MVQNETNKQKHTLGSSSVNRNALLMRENRGEWTDRANRKATVAQIITHYNGSEQKSMSQHKKLLGMGYKSRRHVASYSSQPKTAI